MGQYYKAYIEKDGERKVLYSWDYGCGLKLMEHSWMGNALMNAAYTLIENNPSIVGWIGDYSDDVGVDKEIYRFVWGRDDSLHEKVAPKQFFDGGVGTGYLINHTKKEYISLYEYYLIAQKNGWCVNPLSLLTAIGNGLGGGDYHDCYPNYNMVGYWYMDEIEYSEWLEFEMYPDYTDVTEDVIFKEWR